MQVISVLLGKTKIKTNKLHLATCYQHQSQLQGFFFFFFCQVLELQGDTTMCVWYCSGSDLAGGKEARQESVTKAVPDVNASWLYREMFSLVFPLGDYWPVRCEEDAENSWWQSWWGLETLRQGAGGRRTDRFLTWRSACCIGRDADLNRGRAP